MEVSTWLLLLLALYAGGGSATKRKKKNVAPAEGLEKWLSEEEAARFSGARVRQATSRYMTLQDLAEMTGGQAMGLTRLESVGGSPQQPPGPKSAASELSQVSLDRFAPVGGGRRCAPGGGRGC
jgi:hypothetical protein